MKLVYIDASNAGASGDMLLAAFLKLAPHPDTILKDLITLKDFLPGVKKLAIELVEVQRFGILVNQLKIDLSENKDHRSANQLHSALTNFLEGKNISTAAKNYAISVLESLILAETEVHGKAMDKIHLHELSSVDTLIDIVGVTMALDQLNLFDPDVKILCSELPVGGGTIKGAHGLLPVPAPATANILRKSNLTICNGPVQSELVTPTGAALLANLNPRISHSMINLENISYATGQKEFTDFLNILTIYYGKGGEDLAIEEFQKYMEPVIMLETNVDDISGEIIGDFVNKIQVEDILDIQIIPSITKKNRPSHLIQVLCNPGKEAKLISLFFTELGTLGVRINNINRVCVDRTIEKTNVTIDDKIYSLNYKISYIDLEKGRQIVNIKPEYEDLKRISELTGKPIRELQFYAQEQLNNLNFEDKIKKNRD